MWGRRWGLRRHDRPLRRLPDQLLERIREVVAIVEEEHAPRTALHQEGHQRRIGLRGVAVTAGEHEIVGPVVGRLPFAGPHVIERDGVLGSFGAAIGTDRPVLQEQPITMP